MEIQQLNFFSLGNTMEENNLKDHYKFVYKCSCGKQYGCDKEAKFQMTSGKWCCSEHWNKCSGKREQKQKQNVFHTD